MLGKYQRCISCMKEIGTNNVCPYCGYIEGSPYLPDYLPPKTVLNQRYIVGKLLSYNGEGAVYIAFDAAIEAAVEIREYMPDALCSRRSGGADLLVNPGCETKYKALMSDFVDLMHQLIRMRTLPAVAQTYEIFEQNNTVYAVTEHIEGTTLRQYLNENAGEIDWNTASKLFAPLFSTLSAIHSSNLIHRGISPETILVTNKGEIKLSGFSISSLRAANTELSPQLFSGYAAPEQYSSNSWHGTWTDVYALSAVIYKALTGTMPPEAMTRSVNDNLIAPHILNPSIPKYVSNALAAGLMLSSEQRIQTVAELKNQLYNPSAASSLPAGGGKAAVKPVVPEDAEEEKKKMPAWAIALIVTSAVLLVVLGALLLFLFSGRGGDKEPVSDPSSMVSSASSEVSSTVEVSSQGTSSINMKDIAVENFVGRVAASVTENETYKSKYQFKVTYVYDDSWAAGVIVRQSPEADTAVELNTTVELFVSKGPQFIKIPAHGNKLLAEYESILIQYGLKDCYTIEYGESEGVNPGYVYGTSLDGGTYDMSKKDSGEKFIVYVARETVSSQDDPSSSNTDSSEVGFPWE